MSDTIRTSFAYALLRGTGKAVLIQRDHPFMDFSLEIIKACHQITSYDFWSDGGAREIYLSQLIREAPQGPWIRKILLEQFRDLTIEEDYLLRRLFFLAKEFTRQGQEDARGLMYDKYIELCKDGEGDCGLMSILELDGLKGLFFVAENMGKYLVDQEDFFADDFPIKFTQQQQPERQVENALYLEARSNPFIRRYLELVLETRNKSTKQAQTRYSYSKIKALIKEGTPITGYMAEQLPDAEFARLANDLLETKDEVQQEVLLKLFVQRSFPLDWHRLLQFLKADRWQVREEAISCLARFQDPLLRSIALEELKKKDANIEYLELLHRNAEPEDFLFLHKIMQEKDDDWVHTVGYELLKMFKQQPAWQAANALQLMYDRCHCSICREEAVFALEQIDAIPDAYLSELPFDCSLKLREHFQANRV
ncbi:MAG: hypothetical protein KDC44_14130 [Phaeodactylibacter sp.]|nr:hypothetical protein [Phaeodactylibacter sp.]